MAFTSKGPAIFLSGPDFTPPSTATVCTSARQATRTSDPAIRIFMVEPPWRTPSSNNFHRTVRKGTPTGLPPLTARESPLFTFLITRPWHLGDLTQDVAPMLWQLSFVVQVDLRPAKGYSNLRIVVIGDWHLGDRELFLATIPEGQKAAEGPQ